MFYTHQATPKTSLVKTVKLTKEQTREAQNMFRSANKVTPLEKSLILKFMGGVR